MVIILPPPWLVGLYSHPTYPTLGQISRNKDSETLSEESYRAKLQLHRHLHHPDILAILSTFETPSAFYEILEYAPYGSLSEWISSPQSNSEFGVTYTMTESELRGVLQPLIKALLHMHQNEVLHLNVNPTTIFLTSDYRVVSPQPCKAR